MGTKRVVIEMHQLEREHELHWSFYTDSEVDVVDASALLAPLVCSPTSLVKTKTSTTTKFFRQMNFGIFVKLVKT